MHATYSVAKIIHSWRLALVIHTHFFLSNVAGACSAELRVVKTCAQQLETALTGVESKFVYFTNEEGFITDSDHDELLNPKTLLSDADKARKLVSSIRKRVELDKESYHTLVDWFEKNGKYYAPISRILKEEYERQCPSDCGKLHD